MESITTTPTDTDHPRIYVACLAAYNSGILHGAWIDAAQEPWALWDAVQAVLAVSPVEGAEEWAIHDHEGFGGIRLSEHASLDRVVALASFIVEHGALGAALLDHYGSDVGEAREALRERYHGCHTSLADYVQELTEQATPIPSALRYYIDWQAMARDAELNGDLFTVQIAWGEVHVFGGD
ncbi:MULTISPECIES: antirestriction protein ArdA [unclassified Sphingomonas]|nr:MULTISPECIES: antirestriction protein ArdA [unclassified Sphingomonas]